MSLKKITLTALSWMLFFYLCQPLVQNVYHYLMETKTGQATEEKQVTNDLLFETERNEPLKKWRMENKQADVIKFKQKNGFDKPVTILLPKKTKLNLVKTQEKNDLAEMKLQYQANTNQLILDWEKTPEKTGELLLVVDADKEAVLGEEVLSARQSLENGEVQSEPVPFEVIEPERKEDLETDKKGEEKQPEPQVPKAPKEPTEQVPSAIPKKESKALPKTKAVPLAADLGIAPPASDIDISKSFNVISQANSYVHQQYPSEVVVTDDEKWQYGGAWYKYPLNLSADFSTEMYYYLGNKSHSEGGADGLTFTFHNDPRGLEATGATGAGIGAYANISKSSYIQNALTLEFDTYYNAKGGSEPNTNDEQVPDIAKESGHIAITKPALSVKKHENLLYGSRLANGTWQKLNMRWDAATKTFIYKFAGYPEQRYTVSDVQKVFGGTKVYWGFTGSTGGMHNFQAVSINKLPDQGFLNTQKKVKNVSKNTAFQTEQIVSKGDIVEYEISAEADQRNNVTLPTVKVTDQLDPSLSYLGGLNVTVDGKTVASKWENGIVTLKEVEAGSKIRITFQASVKNYGVIHNAATIESDLTAPIKTNNTKIASGDMKIIKQDAVSKESLQDVEFTLLNSKKESLADGKTDANGELVFTHLSPGEYYVKEIKPLAGYSPNNTAYKVVIPAGQTEPVTQIVPNVLQAKPLLTKTADQTQVKIGDTITYNIELKNAVGAGRWEAVKLEDNLAEQLAYIPGSTQIDGRSVSDEEAVWTDKHLSYRTDHIAAGASKRITFQAKVLSLPPNGIVENRGIATGQDTDGSPRDPSESSCSVSVQNHEGMAIQKQVQSLEGENLEGKNVEVGAKINYHIQLTNEIAGTTLKAIDVKDAVPNSLRVDTASLKVVAGGVNVNYQGGFNKNELALTIAELVHSKPITISFQAEILANASGTIKNIAFAQIPDTPEKKTETSSTAPPRPSIQKSVNKQEATIGELLTYQLTVENGKGGGAWHHPVIKDNLPEELQYIAGSTKIDGKSVSDQTTVWTDQELTTEFPELQAGEKRVITFQVKVTKKPVNNKIRNQAQATGEDAEGEETPPVKTETEIPALNSPDGIRIEKQVADEAGKDMEKKEVQTGDKVYYSILVTNQIADSIQHHIRISDMIPKGLRAEPETLTVTQEKKTADYTGGFQNGNLAIDLAELKGTAPIIIRFAATITPEASGEIKNVAAAVLDGIPEKESNPSDVINPPRPSVQKRASVEKAALGDIFTYEIEVKNNTGGGEWQLISLKDKLPSYLHYIPGTTTINEKSIEDKAWKENSYETTIEKLQAGETYLLRFQVRVVEIPPANKLVNTATVTGFDKDGKEHSPPPAEVVVSSDYGEDDLDISKEILDEKGQQLENAIINVGDKVYYRLQVTNKVANTTLKDVQVMDKLADVLAIDKSSLQVEASGKSVPYQGGINESGLDLQNLTIAEKEPVFITFAVTVKPEASGDIKNMAQANLPNQPAVNSNEVSMRVLPNPYLKKEADKQSIKLGESITFTLTAANQPKAGKWLSPFITDQLPEYLQYQSGTLQVDGKKVLDDTAYWKDNRLTVSLPDMQEQEVHQVTFQTKNIETPANKRIINTIQGSGKDADGRIYQPEEAKTTIQAENNPDSLQIEKRVQNEAGQDIDAKYAAVGDRLQYEIEVENLTGGTKLRDLHIEDQVPSVFQVLPHTLETSESSAYTGGFDQQMLTMDLNELQAGKSVVIRFDVVVTSEASGIVKNKATVNLSGEKPLFSNEVSTIVEPQPYIKKTVSHDQAVLGEIVEYTLIVKNDEAGGKWFEAHVEDTLPKELMYLKGTTKIDGELLEPQEEEKNWIDNRLHIDFSALSAGETHEIKFKAKISEIPKQQKIQNIATSSGEDNDGRSVSAKESICELPVANPNHAVTIQKQVLNEEKKDIHQQEVQVGEQIYYQLTVNNSLEDTVMHELQILDHVPEVFEVASDSLQIRQANGEQVSYSGGLSGQDLDLQINQLDSKSPVTIIFAVRVKPAASGTVENIASVILKNTEATDTAPVLNQIKPKPLITQKADVERTEVGDTFMYTIEVSNQAQAGKWLEVVVNNKLDAHLDYIPGSTTMDGISISDQEAGFTATGNLALAADDLEAGAKHVITLKVRVREMPPTKELQSYAAAYGKDGDQQDVKTEEVNTITPVDNPDDAIDLEKKVYDANEKAIQNKQVQVGDQLHYSISVNNLMPNTKLKEITITDQLPAGLTFVPGSLEVVDQEGTMLDHEDNTLANDLQIKLATIEQQAILHFKVIVNENASGEIKNVAVGSLPDMPDHQSKPVTNTITPQPFIEKEVTPEKVTNNQIVTYMIKVGNEAKSGKWLDPTVVDDLEEQLEYVAGTTTINGRPVSDEKAGWKANHLTSRLDPLTAGEMHILRFQVKIKAEKGSKRIRNTALLVNPPATKDPRPHQASCEVEVKAEKRNPLLPQTGDQLSGILIIAGLLLLLSSLALRKSKRRT